MITVRRCGVALLAIVCTCALAAPWLSTGDVATQYPDYALAGPSLARRDMVERLPPTYRARDERLPLEWFAGHLVRSADPHEPLLPLGSDTLGRDQWTRLLYGARLSLGLAGVALVASVAIGTLVGLVAGRRAGWTDSALMRLADLFIAWPALYVVLVLRAALPLTLPFGTLFLMMAAVLTLAGWAIVARAVRAVTASERSRESVLAAEAAGASPAWIIRRHLLPASVPVIVTQALLLVPTFILAEATLSFVGLGFAEPAPSWGTMLREASNPFTLRHAPWLLAPAGAIALVTLAVNLISGNRQRATGNRTSNGLPPVRSVSGSDTRPSGFRR
ncbi:MAG: ABC transporter permease [Acidobacteria bacterium]|nr:ABC transporter permease [Acidobacteriota bacterium]